MPADRTPAPLPPWIAVRRTFPRPKIENPAKHTREKLLACGVVPKKGASIAVGVGSRGIANLAVIVKAVLEWVKACGAHPFIVPAMGSHGGATPEGQLEVLASYGITEAAMGVPLKATMEVETLPQNDVEVPCFLDRYAYQADGIICINRIKIHTDYHGPFESGIMKMCAIGLGKQAQAMELHARGVRGLRDIMPRVAQNIVDSGRILLGVGIVENAYDETCRIEAMPGREIPKLEQELLDYQRGCMPDLPLDDIDLLCVDQMGKNVSGTGLDTNIIGRIRVYGQPEPEAPCVRMLTVQRMTPESHGNALGVGLADIISRELADGIDWTITNENIFTASFLDRGRLPIVAANGREAVAFAQRALGCPPAEQLKAVRILDTLHLEYLLLTPAALKHLRPGVQLEQLETIPEWFDARGEPFNFAYGAAAVAH